MSKRKHNVPDWKQAHADRERALRDKHGPPAPTWDASLLAHPDDDRPSVTVLGTTWYWGTVATFSTYPDDFMLNPPPAWDTTGRTTNGVDL